MLFDYYFLVCLFRNYDDDFDDEEDGIDGPTSDPLTNKRTGLGGTGGSVVSPPQRLGSTLKGNDIDERWKD